VRVFKQYISISIYGDDKKNGFRETLVNFTPSAKAGVTGKRPVKSGWSSFFGNFVRVFEQHFDLSFREVFEMQIYSWWGTRTQVLFSEVNGMHNFS
jgi:hypothetical protein